MKNSPRPRTSFHAAVLLLTGCAALLLPEILLAHGTIQTPASRVYKCRFEDNPENPQNPACAAAVAEVGSSQFLYDWNGIRQGEANGMHQVVVPDGQLCSGGGAEYAGLDLTRSDWGTTTIEPDSQGNFEFIYHASAPHSTQDMLFYVTPEGWDPTQALTWDSLGEPFCHLTSVTLEFLPGVGDVYRMTCPLPARTGRHVIYHVWQRDDSPEAFYACVDVVMQESSAVFSDGFESGNLSSWSLP